MFVTYTYAIWGDAGREMLVCLPEDEGIPDLRLTVNGEEWTRLSDTDLTCTEGVWQNPRKPAETKVVKCGRFECHRTVLGQCQCGLHDQVRLRPDQT